MGNGSRIFSEVELSANVCLHNVDLLETWQLAIMQKPEIPKNDSTQCMDLFRKIRGSPNCPIAVSI